MTARPFDLSRRAVLRLGAVSAVALPLAACSGGYDESPDPLAPLLSAADADAAAARALGDPVAAQVADARAAQAAALKTEVDRLNRPKTSTAPAAPASNLAGFKERLATARKQAEDLVPTLPAYRAGLAAAVAAGCASLQRLAPSIGPGDDAQHVAAPAGTGAADAVDSLQKALAAEHAALWVYGTVTAFLPGEYGDALKAGRAEHTARRDVLTQVVEAAGGTPVAPEAAYVPPKPVTDTASASALVASAEQDCSAAWLGLVTHTDDEPLRRMALQALIAAARRGTPWRQEAGEKPTALAMPGQPT
ncbi:ferritin-like domain-containing protein [Amycolatopsis sp. FDAARGOS 1241]|uniref:ferritin-like domain-containing protein n=1 Tax=Amycolatopsis sp. FDAARGOS 1241 TaxID=2778070 RepID=UPI00194DC493|nr:ferritin-like domain-containing protein [Amycolatopsis sp. FDAARGOS 1241]QRP50760.1 ferritin-like domain-containing protein [Amycolatopsis sp. FDAARGOS 1241]